MNDSQNYGIDALNLAIRMEIDGQKYYSEQADSTLNEAGKRLFQQLAREELDHRARFEAVFNALSEHGDWPHSAIYATPSSEIRTLFGDIAASSEQRLKGLPTEMAAVQKALDMENASYELYQERYKNASAELERDFYRELAAEERGHYLALLDYQSFLTDPDDWFTDRERHSLDGV